MKLLIVAPYPPGHAPSQRYRFEQYLGRLEADGVRWTLRSLIDEETYRHFHRPGRTVRKGIALIKGLRRRLALAEEVGVADVVLVHREAFPAGGAFIERRLAAAGTPLVFDFDDAIFLRDVSPANRWAGWLKRPEKTAEILSLSAVAVAGNEYLASYARDHCADVRVVPSCVDTGAYLCPPTTAADPREVTIGWTGSVTTAHHLRLLEPILESLQDRLGVRVRVIGDGGYAPEGGLRVEFRQWSAETEVEDVCGIDVGLMPLPDEPWARGKCGLKLLQYMAAGRPAVASPVGVNPEIISHGENGYLAADASEWTTYVARLVENPDLRRRMGAAARRTVVERYSVEATYPSFRGALRAAVGARPEEA